MFHRFCIILILFSNLVIAKPIFIEIVGGREVGVPITVLPFRFQGKMDPIDRAAQIENVSNIIRNDLNNSGHFRAVDSDANAKLQDTGYWKNLGVNSLVTGTIVKNNNGTYEISFQLMDVYKNNKVILSMIFRDRKPPELRALAHHISDLIFKQVTGVRGFFSTRIAYITMDRHRERTMHTLVVADADGYNDKALISAQYPLMSPRWSPDGSKIAFVSFRGHRSSINVVNLATGDIELLTRYPGINGAPAWSPNGQQLAVVLSKDGAPKIYLLDLATKQLRRLTSGASIDTEPFWAPDGQSIYFTSNRGGKPQIYRIALQNGEIQRVTFKGDYNATPSLTPDGKKLIMLHQSEKGAYNIAVQDLSTGKLSLITKSYLDESPSLAPNGMMVLYGLREGTQNILGAVTLDGKFRMRLPIQDSDVKEPAWSPFLY